MLGRGNQRKDLLQLGAAGEAASVNAGFHVHRCKEASEAYRASSPDTHPVPCACLGGGGTWPPRMAAELPFAGAHEGCRHIRSVQGAKAKAARLVKRVWRAQKCLCLIEDQRC